MAGEWRSIGPAWSWVYNTKSFLHASREAVIWQGGNGHWWISWKAKMRDGTLPPEHGPFASPEEASRLLPRDLQKQSEWNARPESRRSRVHGRTPEDVLA